MESDITSKPQSLQFYEQVRSQTQLLCSPLETEDFVPQPNVVVSPLKWHLAHTTWFFETFILVPHFDGYKVFNALFSSLFNSYYISVGACWEKSDRGILTRPTVKEISEYRAYVDRAMHHFMESPQMSETAAKLITLGCHHEQQHQELFLYDVKQILGGNPLFPKYCDLEPCIASFNKQEEWLTVDEGIYEIGFEGEDFHFDNERGKHKVFLHGFNIASSLVSNKEYMEFIDANGYGLHQYWISEGWDWVKKEQIKVPCYWYQRDGGVWWQYSLGGLEEIDENAPVSHISYYEADAFARWKGCRLPTEFEWETACNLYSPASSSGGNFMETKLYRAIQTPDYDFLGNLWEWTSSAYLAYPYFTPASGALGEYNGKFMINQMVLRGGSYATPKHHIRKTYRNFCHPHLRWMFSGIRLANYL